MSTYRPPYSQEQLAQYFRHVQLPAKYLPSAKPALDLDFLTALHVHQISTIPYENLVLHYSTNKVITLDPQALFEKFVTRGLNRGGYCMEDTLFFLFVLQSLGFDAYPTGVRIRLREDGVPKGDFTGLVHIVLIVTLANAETKFIVDTAFGGDGPTKPLPLRENIPISNLGTQENRYILAPIAQNAARPITESQKYWIYQYRNSPEKDWNSFYAFVETEYLLNDFQVMNMFTSSGQTFQRTLILVVKFLRNGSKDGSGKDSGEEWKGESTITGKLMLVDGVLKRNLGGRTEIVKECKNEKERVEALKTWFGILLTEEEVGGIKGLVTELKETEVIVA